MKHTIAKILMEHLNASKVVIKDTSHLHAHHKGTPHSQHTHFEILVISDLFETLTRVKRHQKIYALLSHLFEDSLHALSMTLKTTKEFKPS